MNPWPPAHVFYVRGALVWLCIATLGVALVMGLVALNLLVSSVESERMRHAARLVVSCAIAVLALASIRRLVQH